MDTTTLTQTDQHDLTEGHDRPSGRLELLRRHHSERHETASASLEEFFENLIVLLGFPAPKPQPVRVCNDRPRP